MKKNYIIFSILIIVTAIAVFFWRDQKSGTVKEALKDFAVEDTASIDQLFLADREGNKVTLTKQQGYWLVDGKYRAKSSQIGTLLYTIKSIEVRSPVGKNLYNNTMKLMSSRSTKIEIYQHHQLTKTYYVGHPTMDNRGTFMYLEGSTVPFIMHIPGFNGFLTSRYFAVPEDWRDPAIFHFTAKNINRITIKDLVRPERSFTLMRNPDSTYEVKSLLNNQVFASIDPLRLRNYLLGFEFVNYQRRETTLSTHLKDSLLHAGPFSTIEISDVFGQQKNADCYRLPVTNASKNGIDLETGLKRPYDPDNFFLKVQNDSVWYLVQYFHFDRLLKDPRELLTGGLKTAPKN
jgi:hypothetical protein